MHTPIVSTRKPYPSGGHVPDPPNPYGHTQARATLLWKWPTSTSAPVRPLHLKRGCRDAGMKKPACKVEAVPDNALKMCNMSRRVAETNHDARRGFRSSEEMCRQKLLGVLEGASSVDWFEYLATSLLLDRWVFFENVLLLVWPPVVELEEQGQM